LGAEVGRIDPQQQGHHDHHQRETAATKGDGGTFSSTPILDL
jgi:hypothetical protein